MRIKFCKIDIKSFLVSDIEELLFAEVNASLQDLLQLLQN